MHTDITGDLRMEQLTLTEMIQLAWEHYEHSHRPNEYFIEHNAFVAGWLSCYDVLNTK